MKKKILISTGGSGGHVIPAITFHDHLKEKFDVFLTTDKRGERFINKDKYILSIIDEHKMQNNIVVFVTKIIMCMNFFPISQCIAFMT